MSTNMHNLNIDIATLSYFCPLCGGSTFGEHWMCEYKKDWNKCSSCGYMELKCDSLNRIVNKLAPDQLEKPFVDPITPEIVSKSSHVTIYGKKGKNKSKTSKCAKCANCECCNK